MRYIRKSTGCTQFLEWFTENQPSCWDVPTDVKHTLHSHLWREQQGLCVYCQQAIPEKKTAQSSAQIRSHIEHIRPRRYLDRMFDYDNLSISCEGFDCAATTPQKKEFCEHRKADEYDENQFLNPIEQQEIADYFKYDVEGRIFANHLRSHTDQQKANYMIKILALDHKELNRLREANYLQLIQENSSDIKELLNPNYPLLPAFYPMLDFLFTEQRF
jgi:uncharacterized protein (TIGR02646 family)